MISRIIGGFQTRQKLALHKLRVLKISHLETIPFLW